jgi:hypothetical protein
VLTATIDRGQMTLFPECLKPPLAAHYLRKSLPVPTVKNTTGRPITSRSTRCRGPHGRLCTVRSMVVILILQALTGSGPALICARRSGEFSDTRSGSQVARHWH